MKVIDIETIPQDEAIILANAPEFTAPANIKDPDKIAAAIAKKRADYIADAALNWRTAQIAIIGVGGPDGYKVMDGDEKSVLECFMQFATVAIGDGNTIVGHNIKGFDLPMIINRARVHRVAVSPAIVSLYRGRPSWSECIIDTLELISFGRSFDGNSVEDVSKAFGLPQKLGKGEDFHKLWASSKSSAIEYNKRDIEIETEIAKICGLN